MSKNFGNSWWNTERGRQSRTYLQAWGAVIAEREVSGDPCALPSPSHAVSGGGRSAPGNMPDIALRFQDVERVLRTVNARQKALARFIYVDGLLTGAGADQLVYTLPDMTTVQLAQRDTPPLNYIAVEHRRTRSVSYDLARFPDASLDEYERNWGKQGRKVSILEAEHMMMAQKLARTLGF